VTIINAVRAGEPCSRPSGVEASGNPLQQPIPVRNGSDRRDPAMTVSRPTRLLIADAHPILVRGLEALLRANRDFEVVATCLNGVKAREKIQAFAPDLAVLDLAMPGFTGLDVLAALSRAGSRVRVILLTAAATDQQIVKAVADGAWGLVLKDAAAEDLLACLRSVVNGARWLPPALVDAALDREAERRRERGVSDVTLTAREREIAALVATGLSNKAIARTIGLSDGTVRIHLSNIYQKLGVSNRTALARHESVEGQPGPIPEKRREAARLALRSHPDGRQSNYASWFPVGKTQAGDQPADPLPSA